MFFKSKEGTKFRQRGSIRKYQGHASRPLKRGARAEIARIDSGRSWILKQRKKPAEREVVRFKADDANQEILSRKGEKRAGGFVKKRLS